MIYLDSKSQRWIVDISRRVKNGAGETVRIRKRKTMPKGSTQAQAEAVSNRMDAAEVTRALSVEGADGWDAYVAAMVADPRSWLVQTVQKCRGRAKLKSLPFRLSPGSLAEHMVRTKGRCELTGLKFTTADYSSERKRPFFHSIDRIEPAKGYVPENIRIVCWAANMAMSNWGEDVFAELARGFVFNRYSALNFLRQERPQIAPF